MISHHPDPSTLMSFAAGGLCEALAAVVACHLDVCDHCRGEVSQLETIGAALLELLTGSRLENVAPVMALLRQEADVAPQMAGAVTASGEDLAGASTLRRLLGVVGSIEQVPWRRLGIGVWHHRLPSSAGDLRLLKVAAGRRMPEHGHGGAELTLLLEGAYSDETGAYHAGDVADLDDIVEHTPVADPALGCICLIASEKPARFKGLLQRIAQPLTGM